MTKKQIAKIKKDLIKSGKDPEFVEMILKGSVKPKRII